MIDYKSKSELVYEQLLKQIVGNSFHNGDRLVISRIAREYNVSDIPVREAIRRLESEGYVKHEENKGFTVSFLSKESLIDIFQIRGVLEGYAARLSVDVLTPRDIDKLEEINNELAKSIADGNTDRYSELNQEFHLAMYVPVKNTELITLIRELWQKWSVTMTVFKVAHSRVQHSVEEHRHILDLIRAGKSDEVETVVRQHKFAAGQEMVAELEKLSLVDPIEDNFK